MTMQACYWFVGTKNFSQRMFVAIDVFDNEDCELTRPTHTIPCDSRVHGKESAENYCLQQFNIAPINLVFDDDSTQCCEHD